jgi:acyl-CoA synthetase (AMP-forming)/AMP-acid ligase II
MNMPRYSLIVPIVPFMATEYGYVDKINHTRGLTESFEVVYPQLKDLDFITQAPKLDVPVYIFVGRSDDIILTAGYRVGPCEVENILMEHPSVLEAAVVSSPDPIRGEVIKAFIRLNKNFKPSPELTKEIQHFVREATAPYKYPRLIEFVDDLPKTISGKIRRSELRQREWDPKAKNN